MRPKSRALGFVVGALVGAAALVAAVVAWSAAASAKDDTKRELQIALNDNGLQGDWIYDDAGEAFAVAKRTGRPILLVFR